MYPSSTALETPRSFCSTACNMAGIPPPPPPPRRFVTGHTPSGSSTILFEDNGTQTAVQRGKFYMLWHDAQPSDNAAPTDDNAVLPTQIIREDGSLCRIVDLQPHGSTPLHRTVSLDYGILLAGQMELELENVDGGPNQFQVLKVGDVVVQRGTNHAWHNCGDTWARMAFIMLASNKIELNGKTLEPGGI
jgi:quercetin dioxygenase-like cupin family protein